MIARSTAATLFVQDAAKNLAVRSQSVVDRQRPRHYRGEHRSRGEIATAAAGDDRAHLRIVPSAERGNPHFAGSKAMAVTARIQVNEADGIKVVRFDDHQLFDERTVREAADQIAAALPNDGSPIRLVVDFSDVSLISSTFLSKLILLQRRIDAHTRQAAALRDVADHPTSLSHLKPRSPVQDRPRSAHGDRLVSLTTARHKTASLPLRGRKLRCRNGHDRAAAWQSAL